MKSLRNWKKTQKFEQAWFKLPVQELNENWIKSTEKREKKESGLTSRPTHTHTNFHKLNLKNFFKGYIKNVLLFL